MKRREIIRLLTGGTAAVAMLGLSGCIYYPESYAAAPAYDGRYRDYDYYYYPDVNVYFHILTGWYWWHDGGAWRRARTLPRHIHVRPERRHRMVIRDREPWRRNHEHRREYRAFRDGPRDGPRRRRRDW